MDCIVLVKNVITESQRAFGIFSDEDIAEAWARSVALNSDEIYSVISFRKVVVMPS